MMKNEASDLFRGDYNDNRDARISKSTRRCTKVVVLELLNRKMSCCLFQIWKTFTFSEFSLISNVNVVSLDLFKNAHVSFCFPCEEALNEIVDQTKN